MNHKIPIQFSLKSWDPFIHVSQLFQKDRSEGRSEGFTLRDMISLGAWKMGLGCPGKILPSSPPPPSPTRIWKTDSSRVSLRNRSFRSARIDPSSLPKHRRTNCIIFLVGTNQISKNSQKTILKKYQKQA